MESFSRAVARASSHPDIAAMGPRAFSTTSKSWPIVRMFFSAATSAFAVPTSESVPLSMAEIRSRTSPIATEPSFISLFARPADRLDC